MYIVYMPKHENRTFSYFSNVSKFEFRNILFCTDFVQVI